MLAEINMACRDAICGDELISEKTGSIFFIHHCFCNKPFLLPRASLPGYSYQVLKVSIQMSSLLRSLP
jgi:hypothetical protein